jgi:hypothetical protein
MKTELRGLKKLYQAYVISKRPPNRAKCPSAEAMAQIFEPSMSVRKKKKIVDHISDCSFCRNEFTILFEMRKFDTDNEAVGSFLIESPGRNSIRTKRRPNRPIWQYACVLLGLGLAVYSVAILDIQNEVIDAQRAADADIVLTSPVHNKTLKDIIIFRWKAKKASDYYVLELFDEAYFPIWTSGNTYDDQVSLPPDIRAKLNQGRPYYWMVTAFIHDSQVGESALARFFVH